MNIHEYQAKKLLAGYKVPTPRGYLITKAADAEKAAADLGTPVVVVKSQIHAGGRGKGRLFRPGQLQGSPVLEGGVQVVRSPAAAREACEKILGNILVTQQTGPEGKEVKQIWIEEGVEIAKEYYLGAVLDRTSSRIVIMASTEGGVEIEEVAHRSPEKILKEAVDPAVGLKPYQARKLAFGLGLQGKQIATFASLVDALYQAFMGGDCAIVEINPLVITKQGNWLACDAKINLEDNALYRHSEYAAWRDISEEAPAETEARNYDLAYIALDGNIGCMVNGAGLAMATLDIIQQCGGKPANFLDVGGGATTEKVTAAFKIILSDPKVSAILVNIFGGIMKCDVIAAGIIEAAKQVNLTVPLVVRLQGTNVAEGRALLAGSGLKITPAETIMEAAQKVVAAA